MRRYRKVGGTFFYYYSYSSIRMCGLALLFLIRSQTHNSGSDIIGWPGRACVCVCISLGLSVRVTPQVPPDGTHTRRTLRVHKRELVGSSARHTHTHTYTTTWHFFSLAFCSSSYQMATTSFLCFIKTYLGLLTL
jgi:hypothetical protein